MNQNINYNQNYLQKNNNNLMVNFKLCPICKSLVHNQYIQIHLYECKTKLDEKIKKEELQKMSTPEGRMEQIKKQNDNIFNQFKNLIQNNFLNNNQTQSQTQSQSQTHIQSSSKPYSNTNLNNNNLINQSNRSNQYISQQRPYTNNTNINNINQSKNINQNNEIKQSTNPLIQFIEQIPLNQYKEKNEKDIKKEKTNTSSNISLNETSNKEKVKNNDHEKHKEKTKDHKENKEYRELKENKKEENEIKDLKKDSKKEFQIENYIPPQVIQYNDQMLYHFFKLYETLFIEYIRNKSIAIVGPSESIIGTKKGHIIDKFDRIVRLNKSIPLPQNLKDDIGSRTDILYNSLNTSDFPGENKLSPTLHKKYGIKFVCTSYPYGIETFKYDILNYVKKYKFELPLKVMDDQKYRKFENVLGTRPYTGTCAIMDILSYPIKFLYITGLDFYQTKYYSQYREINKSQLKNTRNSNVHNAAPQLSYLKHIALIDDRIILDDFLDKLIYQNYYIINREFKKIKRDNILGYGNEYFYKYFQMNDFFITFTKESIFDKKDIIPSSKNLIIITNNDSIHLNKNEYAIKITNNAQEIQYLNEGYERKRFIGNFYYNWDMNNNNKQRNKIIPPSFYLQTNFLKTIHNILNKIEIKNASLNLLLILSIMIHFPDNHIFMKDELKEKIYFATPEKKLINFLIKKKILHVI